MNIKNIQMIRNYFLTKTIIDKIFKTILPRWIILYRNAWKMISEVLFLFVFHINIFVCIFYFLVDDDDDDDEVFKKLYKFLLFWFD